MSFESSSTVVHTEDAVHALIDFLVDPVLSVRTCKDEPPSLSEQQSVAKQMHAVVLLYNYYHRKQFPQLKFLGFESFCKMAVIAKPGLLVYLKYMQKGSADGPNNNLSITEKAIMQACDVSLRLDASKDAPTMECWPISKVAVFLTDSIKENCLLLFSARTQGVWSLIEKNDGESGDISECVLGEKVKSKRKRATNDETCLQRLAMSAVKETTGIDPAELIILESHVAYSLSEEKTTTHFFVMKCKSVKEDAFEVPIKDAINSLEGPLVKKSCNGSIASDVVEYFHLLPYAGIIKEWFSREMLADDSVLSKDENNNMELSPRNDEPLTKTKNECSSNCPIASVPDLKTNSSENLEGSDNHASRLYHTDKDKSSKFSHPSEERKTTSQRTSDNDLPPKNVESAIVATEKSNESSGTCQIENIQDLKKTNSGHLNGEENSDYDMSRLHSMEKSKSSKFSHPSEDRKVTSKRIFENDLLPKNVEPLTIVATKRSSGSSGNCQIETHKDLETNTSEKLNQEGKGNDHTSSLHNIDKSKSSKFYHRSVERKTSKRLLDKDLPPKNVEPLTTVATEKSNGSSGNCQIENFQNNSSETSNQEEKGDNHMSSLHNVDESKSLKVSHTSEERKHTSTVLVENAATKIFTECPLRSTKSDFADKEDKPDPAAKACNNENVSVKVAGRNEFYTTVYSAQEPKRDHSLVPFKSDTCDFVEVQAVWASKGDEMLRASLRLLLKRRNELHHQQRQLEDEIARCEKNIETIISGGEDNLVWKIESLVEACNAASSTDATETHGGPLKCVKRKRLSEATLQLQNPCQELDDICSENNWKLPRYTVLPSHGGFQSNVTAQGIDFQFSGGGDIRSNAREARESAAAQILKKLRSMAKQAH